MKQIGYLSFFLLTIFSSCQEQSPLSGTIEWSADKGWHPTVYLIQPRSLDEIATSFAGIVLDSAKINTDGSFIFNKLPNGETPTLLALAVQKKGARFVNQLDNEDLMTANYMPITWSNGEKLSITAKIEQFQQSFSIKKPSPENAALLQLRDNRLQLFQKYLTKNKAADAHDTSLLEQESALLNFQQPLMKFAKSTEYLFPALLAIRWVSPQNDYERVPEFLVAQCQKWQEKNSTHPWAAQLCQKANRAQLPVLIGDKVPDFPLPMNTGDTITLHQLKGTKLTLLDLWASWCAPCRHENRDFLVPLWEKHHESGFQIIGYALDNSERTWKKAIEKDGVFRWPHASHLRGDDAPLLDKLRIQTIPANFLIDTEGKVVEKNLHGADLVKFVEEYLGKN